MMNAAFKSGFLQSAIYTVSFKRTCAGASTTVDNAGVVTYGGVDTTSCDKNVKYEKLNPNATYGDTWKISEFTLGGTTSTSDRWASVHTSYTEPNIVIPGKYEGTQNTNPPPVSSLARTADIRESLSKIATGPGSS